MKFGRLIEYIQHINCFLLDIADEGKGARLKKQIKDSVGSVDLNLESTDLAGANLSGVNLSGANLRKADLEEALLNDADLSYAALEDANLRWANLKNANLKHANLRRADLRGANVTGADLGYTNLKDASLNESIVAVPYPEVGNLYKDSSVKIKISGTRFDKDTQWPNGFDPIKAGAVCEDLSA